MEVKRVRVTNRKQFNFLVDRMGEHPSVARGQKFSEAAGLNRQAYNDIWKELVIGLNSLGPPTRIVKDWQKVWTDYKNTIKNKLAHNNREAKATGGGPNSMKILSPTEDVVVKLLSFDKMVNHSVSAFGLPRRVAPPPSPTPGPSQPRNIPSPPGSPVLSSSFEPYFNTTEGEDPVDEVVERIENDNTYNSSRTGQRKRRHPDFRHDMLAEQTKCITKIVEHTGECARYARKMYKLREQTIKQQREYMLQKAKDRKEELEYKLELLKYKKKKLDILERRERKK